jgi:hypothetical protein
MAVKAEVRKIRKIHVRSWPKYKSPTSSGTIKTRKLSTVGHNQGNLRTRLHDSSTQWNEAPNPPTLAPQARSHEVEGHTKSELRITRMEIFPIKENPSTTLETANKSSLQITQGRRTSGRRSRRPTARYRRSSSDRWNVTLPTIHGRKTAPKTPAKVLVVLLLHLGW